MKRSFCALVAVALLGMGCGQARAAQRPPSGEREDERIVVDLVNKARSRGARCGSRYYRPAPPLAWNSKLARAALRQSGDMSENSFMGHTGSDGSSPDERVEEAGYTWSRCAENVCVGYRTPAEAVQGWLESEGHCRNIMNPAYREAGAALARGRDRRPYWTVVFGTAMR